MSIPDDTLATLRAAQIGALDAFLYRDRPVRVLAPSYAETSGALFHALSPGAEAVLIGGDEDALRAAGFEILPCPVPEATRVRKPLTPKEEGTLIAHNLGSDPEAWRDAMREHLAKVGK